MPESSDLMCSFIFLLENISHYFSEVTGNCEFYFPLLWFPRDPQFEQRSQFLVSQSTSGKIMISYVFKDHLYMRPEENSNRFKISSRFEKSFCLNGNCTMANPDISSPFQKLFCWHKNCTTTTFQTIMKFWCTCTHDSF